MPRNESIKTVIILFAKNRYHALLELYNEALEEPKEVDWPNFSSVSIFVCGKAKSVRNLHHCLHF